MMYLVAAALGAQCGNPEAGPALGGIDLIEAASVSGQNASLRRGSETHGVNAFGYRFLFVSGANADTFRSEPASHVPLYGGYCGIAMTGHDDCCSPHKACLGPTCLNLNESYGTYAGRLVFFFSPRVRSGWDGNADANLAAANSYWATLVRSRNITVSGGVAHCFNTDYLWCLEPGPIPPPPFPTCGNASAASVGA